ncbi:MAG TPA: hypothetical protein PKI61_01435 [bacterium]|nr:hypothetical protein [bacterium]HPT29549.1 hypothetical protein [bacterium]
MSSKKRRSRIRQFHQNAFSEIDQKDSGESRQEKIEKILKELKGFSVIFPEITSGPIKIGVPLEATIQIGTDEPQPKRLIYAAVSCHVEHYMTDLQLAGFRKLKIDKAKKLILAPKAKSREDITILLRILHVIPLEGYAMTPAPIFKWYGREKVTITEITECPAATELVEIPFCEIDDVIYAGSYIGREIDGMEVFSDGT